MRLWERVYMLHVNKEGKAILCMEIRKTLKMGLYNKEEEKMPGGDGR